VVPYGVPGRRATRQSRRQRQVTGGEVQQLRLSLAQCVICFVDRALVLGDDVIRSCLCGLLHDGRGVDGGNRVGLDPLRVAQPGTGTLVQRSSLTSGRDRRSPATIRVTPCRCGCLGTTSPMPTNAGSKTGSAGSGRAIRAGARFDTTRYGPTDDDQTMKSTPATISLDPPRGRWTLMLRSPHLSHRVQLYGLDPRMHRYFYWHRRVRDH
jgi:hypothetical protein